MAISMEECAPMMSKSKFDKSMLSISSTYAGDSSSDHIDSCDEKTFMDTEGLSDNEDGPGFEPTYPALDRSSMPSTRENSPEPTWNHGADHYLWNQKPRYLAEQYQHPIPGAGTFQPSVVPQSFNTAPYGVHNMQPQGYQLPRRSSRDPPAARQKVNPPAQPNQPVLFVPQNQQIVFIPGAPPAGVMLPLSNCGAMPYAVQTMPTQPASFMLSGMPTPNKETLPPQPTEAVTEATPTPSVREQKEQLKPSGKSKNRRNLKNESAFSKMSAEQKEALCKYIYEIIKSKGFTSQEGYLIVDVFSEVWKDIGDTTEGWRVAQHRFLNLLRAAPDHFRLFRRGIPVANHCGWFARKGDKMVRLVLEEEK
jgi:hypothetical protein